MDDTGSVYYYVFIYVYIGENPHGLGIKIDGLSSKVVL